MLIAGSAEEPATASFSMLWSILNHQFVAPWEYGCSQVEQNVHACVCTFSHAPVFRLSSKHTEPKKLRLGPLDSGLAKHVLISSPFFPWKKFENLTSNTKSSSRLAMHSWNKRTKGMMSKNPKSRFGLGGKSTRKRRGWKEDSEKAKVTKFCYY